MGDHRHVKLFRNGRNQAVRIPVDFELPGDEAIMIRDGDLLIAAHAHAADAVVVTANTDEFKRVRGLKVENWFA